MTRFQPHPGQETVIAHNPKVKLCKFCSLRNTVLGRASGRTFIRASFFFTVSSFLRIFSFYVRNERLTERHL